MADNILPLSAAFGRRRPSGQRQDCTELLVQTISLLQKQIERAEQLLGPDQAHLFLRAIDAHIADKLAASLQTQTQRQREQS
jgi:hypothetical protein